MEMKKFDISIEILKYISEHDRCSNKDIIDAISIFGISEPTIQRRIKKLRDSEYIKVFDREYTVNYMIKDISKDLSQQINEGKLQKVRRNFLDSRERKYDFNKREDLKKELRRLLFRSIKFDYKFDGVNNKEIYLGEHAIFLLQNLLLEHLIFNIFFDNKDLIHLFNKQENFNFEITFKGNLGSNEEFFNLIQKYRNTIEFSKEEQQNCYKLAIGEQTIRQKGIKQDPDSYFGIQF